MAFHAAKNVSWMSATAREVGGVTGAEYPIQANLVRDIIGNLFHPVALDLAWQTPTVTALATATYEERMLPAGTLDPDRLAVLADALEDAGCDNADILSHLRGAGPHVRGCFVVDLLLGKKTGIFSSWRIG